MSVHFSIPTSNTSKIIKEGKRLTNKLFLPGYEYQKVGVMLMNISDAKNEQSSFLDKENYNKSDNIMKSLDVVNKQFGSGSLILGAQGIQKNWRMKADRKSGAYTTNLKDLPIVK